MGMKEFFMSKNATYCNVDLTYIHFVSQTFYSLKAIHSLNPESNELLILDGKI